MQAILNSAITDIRAGYVLRAVWIALAAEDIGDQHRRTTLGPLWLLVNYLLFAATFIFLFNPNPADLTYPVYVATGLLVWYYLMEALSLAAGLFQREEAFIRGTTLPMSVYIMRTVLQCLIRAIYALVGCVIILVLAGIPPTITWLWALPGLALVILVTPALITVFAFTGAFFPDSNFLVGNFMRVGMFITPVFWSGAGETGLRGALYYFNPFTYFLEIVRHPLVDGTVPAAALGLCAAITVGLWALALFLLGRHRRQIALIL
jgi:lipopolysaccharide transport system permease protein